jgi:hypothetical protein
MAQNMTELLERVVNRLASLSDQEQDRYASEILTSLDADAKWDKLLASEASQRWLATAAEEARKDVAEGRVLGLDRSINAKR